MKTLLCPSMMCADFSNLEREIDLLDNIDVDSLHLDLMDGQFVPNFGMGIQDIDYICKNSKKLKEIHMMIERPGNYIDKFIDLGVDIIYIHPEADYHTATTLEHIKMNGGKAGVVLSPGTSLESIWELMYIVDYIMIMSVNPGQAGQICLPYVDNKIQKLIEIRKRENLNFIISIDGACSEQRIIKLSKIGVDAFVLGTSGLFMKDGRSYKDIINSIRNKL